MGVHNGDNKLAITTELKNIRFNLTKKIKHDIDHIIKQSISSQRKNNNEIEQLLTKYKHGHNIHEHRKL